MPLRTTGPTVASSSLCCTSCSENPHRLPPPKHASKSHAKKLLHLSSHGSPSEDVRPAASSTPLLPNPRLPRLWKIRRSWSGWRWFRLRKEPGGALPVGPVPGAVERRRGDSVVVGLECPRDGAGGCDGQGREINGYHGIGKVPLADLFKHKTAAEDVHLMTSPQSSQSDSDICTSAMLLLQAPLCILSPCSYTICSGFTVSRFSSTQAPSFLLPAAM